MDISKASNFERFIFDLTGRNAEKTAQLFGPELQAKGQFSLAHEPFFNQAAQHYGFQSGKSAHQNRLDTIRAASSQQGQILDPHTADGIKVARDWVQTDTPMVVLETALPIKFESTILEALGRSPDMPSKFAHLENLPQRVEVMSTDVGRIKSFIEKHCTTP
jgi:threonine synthase